MATGPGVCKRCKRPIVRAETEGGRRVNVDARPSSRGTWELYAELWADGAPLENEHSDVDPPVQLVRWVGRIVRQLDLLEANPPGPVAPRWVWHRETCPAARKARAVARRIRSATPNEGGQTCM